MNSCWKDIGDLYGYEIAFYGQGFLYKYSLLNEWLKMFWSMLLHIVESNALYDFSLYSDKFMNACSWVLDFLGDFFIYC